MELIDLGTYRFDYLLSFIALLTWVKTIMMFRLSQAFGPMFKIIEKMLYDLGKFLAIWTMILMAFTCVSTLLFGSSE